MTRRVRPSLEYASVVRYCVRHTGASARTKHLHESPPPQATIALLPVSPDRDLFRRKLIRHLSGALQDVVGLEEAAGFVSIVGQRMGDENGEAPRFLETAARGTVAPLLRPLVRMSSLPPVPAASPVQAAA
jgi:hypothetical protein